MSDKLSRRKLMQAAGIAALASPVATPARAAAMMPENKFEGKDTPKICLAIGDGGGGGRGGAPGSATDPAAAEAAAARKIKQLGVNYVIGGGGGGLPWDETRLRIQMESLKANGLTVGNMMIAG